MKINQIGIQSYQQLNRRDTQPQSSQDATTRPVSDGAVTIAPQAEGSGSKLAVAAPQSYAEFLSADERKALDLLFARFKDTGRFGANYKADAAAETADPAVGQLIDVKV